MLVLASNRKAIREPETNKCNFNVLYYRFDKNVEFEHENDRVYLLFQEQRLLLMQRAKHLIAKSQTLILSTQAFISLCDTKAKQNFNIAVCFFRNNIDFYHIFC